MFIGGLNWDTTDGTYVVYYIHSSSCAVVLNSVPYCQSLSESISRNSARSKHVPSCEMPRVVRGALRSSRLKIHSPSTRSWSGSTSWTVKLYVPVLLTHPITINRSLFFLEDRSQTRYSAPGTSASHEVVHRSASRQCHLGIYAGIFLSVWQSCRCHRHVGPGDREEQRFWLRILRERQRRASARIRQSGD